MAPHGRAACGPRAGQPGRGAAELRCTPDPPGETLGDMHTDADAVGAALDEEDEPLVLVGHSYGGMVITDAAAGRENVRHLVYLTSVMPEWARRWRASAGGGSRGRGWIRAWRTARWA